jgi:hypothetical protein
MKNGIKSEIRNWQKQYEERKEKDAPKYSYEVGRLLLVCCS